MTVPNGDKLRSLIDRFDALSRSYCRHRSRTVPGSLWHRQAGQNVVEYGLVVAVTAVLAIVGLHAMGVSAGTYLGGAVAGLAPTAVTATNPRDQTTLNLQPAGPHKCIPYPPVAGDTLTCTAIVTDGTSTRAPTGQVQWAVKYSSGFTATGTCSLVPLTGNSSSCAQTVPTSIPETITVSAVYNPPDPPFLASADQAQVVVN
jgi:hypothetical protein